MLYLLLSDDPTDLAAGVDRQRMTASASPTERASTSSVYVDNDRSAYRGKPCPAFEQMLAEASHGGLDIVVVWASGKAVPPGRRPDPHHRGVRGRTGLDGLRVNWTK